MGQYGLAPSVKAKEDSPTSGTFVERYGIEDTHELEAMEAADLAKLKTNRKQIAMILYHRTHNADAILRDGFRDEEGSYGMEDFTLRGVFLSDKPLSIHEGAGGDYLLEVISPDECCDFSYYELVEEVNRTVNGVFPQRSSTGMERFDSR